MSAVFESTTFDTRPLEVSETRQRQLSAGRYGLAPAPAQFDGLRRASRRWNSSLSERDLNCLLQILEADVIPQMLRGYSPARHAPLSSDASTG